MTPTMPRQRPWRIAASPQATTRPAGILACLLAGTGWGELSLLADGLGGADPSRGSGLIGLQDRVEALGGTISVLSPPGRGTTLHVQLPADPMAVPARPGDTP